MTEYNIPTEDAMNRAKEVTVNPGRSGYRCIFCTTGIYSKGCKVMSVTWYDDMGTFRGGYAHKTCFTTAAVALKLKGWK